MTFTKSSNKLLAEFLPDLLALRRHLHAHPELSGEEHQTAVLVAGELRRYGWRVREAVGRTGVVAELGPSDGALVGLRVDMDALPVDEKTGLEYASRRQGVMHACGHDLHTCIGLGVARLLVAQQPLLTGVRLLFQPAEEIAAGARWMRNAGATKGLDALFGVHVFPDLPVGQVGVRSGSLTAAAGELEIEVLGEGGHGARPHEAVDAIWVAAKIVSGLQESISRCLDALHPVVISIGRIEGGSAFNVIAERVRLLGTVRCLDSDFHETLPSWIEEKVQSIASSLGAKAVVNYRCIAPPVFNDHELTALLESTAVNLLGRQNVLRIEEPSLGAEDFAELLNGVRGTMFRLGVAGKDGCPPLHNGQFCPDEDSLRVGVELLTATICTWMEAHSKIDIKKE